MFNTYKNLRGQTLPKSPIIANSEAIRSWLKEYNKFAYQNSINSIHDTDKYLMVGIGASYSGYLYPYITTLDENEIGRYDASMIKDFTDDEVFKRYLKWALNIPRYVVNH